MCTVKLTIATVHGIIDLMFSRCFFLDPPQFRNQTSVIGSDTFNCTVVDTLTVSCASYPGISGTFHCGVTGNPPPTVSLAASGVTSTSNVDLEPGNTNISITSVVAGNAGIYTCTASSSGFDSVMRRFQLFVGGRSSLYCMSTCI